MCVYVFVCVHQITLTFLWEHLDKHTSTQPINKFIFKLLLPIYRLYILSLEWNRFQIL